MRGLMMDYPLTLDIILRRAVTFYGDREVVSRLVRNRWHRYGYAEMARRAKRLALAISRLGIGQGERIAADLIKSGGEWISSVDSENGWEHLESLSTNRVNSRGSKTN